jgi:hypothetical protein
LQRRNRGAPERPSASRTCGRGERRERLRGQGNKDKGRIFARGLR